MPDGHGLVHAGDVELVAGEVVGLGMRAALCQEPAQDGLAFHERWLSEHVQLGLGAQRFDDGQVLHQSSRDAVVADLGIVEQRTHISKGTLRGNQTLGCVDRDVGVLLPGGLEHEGVDGGVHAGENALRHKALEAEHGGVANAVQRVLLFHVAITLGVQGCGETGEHHAERPLSVAVVGVSDLDGKGHPAFGHLLPLVLVRGTEGVKHERDFVVIVVHVRLGREVGSGGEGETEETGHRTLTALDLVEHPRPLSGSDARHTFAAPVDTGVGDVHSERPANEAKARVIEGLLEEVGDDLVERNQHRAEREPCDVDPLNGADEGTDDLAHAFWLLLQDHAVSPAVRRLHGFRV